MVSVGNACAAAEARVLACVQRQPQVSCFAAYGESVVDGSRTLHARRNNELCMPQRGSRAKNAQRVVRTRFRRGSARCLVQPGASSLS
jgi:hypothetical protein